MTRPRPRKRLRRLENVDVSRPRRRAPAPAAAAGHLRGAPRRRRRSPLPAMAALLTVAAMVAVSGWWWLGRPAVVTVSVTPADALVVFGSDEPTGAPVTYRDLEPGSYTVRVERAGFEPAEATVRAERGKTARVALRLEPLPQSVSVSVEPAGAALVLSSGGDELYNGTAPYEGELPSGPLELALRLEGYNEVTREFFLDAPVKLAFRLDPEGQLLHGVCVFKCVPAPKGLAITPDNRQVWVTALVTQPSVVAYDARTGKELGGVDLGESGAVEVVFNRDGSRAYASQMQSASVFEIDTRTFKVLRRLKTGSAWTKVVALSPDEKVLYAANWSGDDVSEIDLATGELVRRIPTVDTPRGLYPTADGERLFVAGFGENSATGRLQVIDLATGRGETFLEKRGAAMRHMVADERRGVLFTSDMGSDVVWVTEMATLKTRKFADVDSHPNTIDVSPDGRVLFVSCRGRNNPVSYNLPGPDWGSILLFDTTNGKPLDAIVGGNQCTALDLSPDGRLLVFSDFLDARLHTYEVPGYETLAAGKGGRYQAHFREIVK
ncbi:MAG: PEGA domain-containing protein [Coriobacteriia bacterium]|nr:PEGA domain-containing protein [Coriobacteriia bacterium]